MKTIWPIVLCLVLAFAASAQEELVPADVLQQANEWLTENIDDAALDALGVDKDRVQKFLAELQKRFQGTYVYDLGTLRETAKQVQPLLESFEETQPYAVWLKAHLDYFDVSERLRKEVTAKSTNMTRLPDASPQLQRSVWVKVIEERPAPATTNKQIARLKQNLHRRTRAAGIGLDRGGGILLRRPREESRRRRRDVSAYAGYGAQSGFVRRPFS